MEVRLAPASNTFEIANGDQLAVTGKIFIPDDSLTLEEQTNQSSENGEEGAIVLSTKDAYKELRLRGYEYGGVFQGIVQAKDDGKEYSFLKCSSCDLKMLVLIHSLIPPPPFFFTHMEILVAEVESYLPGYLCEMASAKSA